MVITFLDFETTNAIPAQCDILTGHFKTLNLRTYELIDQLSITSKPDKWCEESVAIHGITRNEAENFQAKSDALRKILLYAQKYHEGFFCCHSRFSMFGISGYFDWQVLRLAAFYESDKCYYWFQNKFRGARIISTHTMAKRLIHLDNYSLSNVAEYFDFRFNAHNAEEDVDASIYCFKRLMDLSGCNNDDDLFNLGNGNEYSDSDSNTDWKIGGLL
jgi:DNA polymerase III epsilon subunit-like protein